MTSGSTSRRLVAVWCVVVLILGTVSGAAVTASYLSDRERSAGTVGAAADFTADVGNVDFSPPKLEADSEGTFKARLVVPNRDEVDTTRFTLSTPDGTGSVSATRATCTNPEDGWDCTVTFLRQPVVDLVGTGTHTLVVNGWWQYDRDFEATGTLTVTDSGEPSGTTESANRSTLDAESGTNANATRAAGNRTGANTTLNATNTTLNATNATLNATNATLNATNTTLNATNTTLNATNTTLNATNTTLNATNATLNATNTTLNATNATLDTTNTTDACTGNTSCNGTTSLLAPKSPSVAAAEPAAGAPSAGFELR